MPGNSPVLKSDPKQAQCRRNDAYQCQQCSGDAPFVASVMTRLPDPTDSQIAPIGVQMRTFHDG
jgi:hypothetical protein